MLYTVMQYAAFVALGIGIFFLGGQFPNAKKTAELVAMGMRSERRRLLRGFIDSPWVCRHSQRGFCKVAELECGYQRISLTHLDIPDGTTVNFIEFVDGARWNPLTPFLGGVERELVMTVPWSDQPPDDGVIDD